MCEPTASDSGGPFGVMMYQAPRVIALPGQLGGVTATTVGNVTTVATAPARLQHNILLQAIHELLGLVLWSKEVINREISQQHVPGL